ncbi:MAG TPA: glycosyltransferase family 39 protein [Thermoanaerobaculia bacterium]|nr:glycosyltransferase family 39 protein [Thermoanaerobaculia bacterium]
MDVDPLSRPRRGPRPLRAHLGLFVVLLVTLALSAWGISWGLPSRDGWAGDEIVPRAVAAVAEHDFAGGWPTLKYPPLHYLLLGAVHAPVRAAAGPEVAPPELNYRQMLAGRWLSIVMALGAVWAVYRAARETTGHRGAALAALMVAVVPTFVYFAKTANPEMPMLFWLALALWLYLRVLRRHRWRDWLLLAVAAALAVGTKDQAYGFFVLAPLALLPSLAAHRRAEGLPGGLRTLADRRLLLALLAGLLAFVLAWNLPANRQGLRDHVRTLTGAGALAKEAREHPPTPAGHLANLAQNVRHLAFCLGGPLFAVCAAGAVAALAAALRRRAPRDRLLAALLLLGLSYYLTFLAPILFSRDRYTLPLVLVLAPCGGALLARLLAAARGPARPLLAAALLAAFAWSASRAVSLDRRMTHDSRYAAEAWLAAHGVPPKTALAIGRPRHVPRIDRLDWRKLRRGALRRRAPDYVVVNQTDLRTPFERRVYQSLLEGTEGYRLARRFHWTSPWDTLDTKGALTTLDLVNPRLAVFARVEKPFLFE